MATTGHTHTHANMNVYERLLFERWMERMYGLTFDHETRCWVVEPRLNRRELPQCEHVAEKEFMEYLEFISNVRHTAQQEPCWDDVSLTDCESNEDSMDFYGEEVLDSRRCTTVDDFEIDCNMWLDRCASLCTKIEQGLDVDSHSKRCAAIDKLERECNTWVHKCVSLCTKIEQLFEQ